MSANARQAAPETPYHGQVVEEIIARVNDRVISTSDYDRAENELDQSAKQRNWSQAELDNQKKNLLRDLIDNQLLLSKGKQLGITGDAETVRQLDELRKQNNLPSMEALEKAAADQGVNFADFKASIQNRIVTSQVIRDEVGRRINITPGELQQYYAAHKDQFTTPENVNLSEILIPTADPDNAAQVAEAKKKADDVEAQLKAGKDFAELAKANSGGSTAAQGGLLGDYKKGQLGNVLDDAVFPLQAGQSTEPIRTRQGYILLKVNQHTAAGLQPFEQVRGQVEDAMGEQKMQPALRAYLTTLREQASIEVRSGYTDSAASLNEMHPVFSAYTPPVKKKKKKEERTRFTGHARGRNSTGSAAATSTAANSTAVGATAATATTETAAAPAKPKKKQPVSNVEQAGKREKVRFGQAPRETLPAAEARTQDAGASTANGNGSAVETAQAANTQQQALDGISDEQPVQKKPKTRYSQVAVNQAKAKKAQVKAADEAANAKPETTDELSDISEQSQPLGLQGDETKKKKVKPVYSGKTRFSDEAKKPKAADGAGQGTATQPTPDAAPADATGTTPPAQPQGAPAPAPQQQPQ